MLHAKTAAVFFVQRTNYTVQYVIVSNPFEIISIFSFLFGLLLWLALVHFDRQKTHIHYSLIAISWSRCDSNSLSHSYREYFAHIFFESQQNRKSRSILLNA